MQLQGIRDEFQAAVELATTAGCCSTKARYFANKKVQELYGVNVFSLLGLTKKSVPNSDEILHAVINSEEPVTAADILLEYPFTRLDSSDVVDMLSKFEAEDLIKFDGKAYIGA